MYDKSFSRKINYKNQKQIENALFDDVVYFVEFNTRSDKNKKVH